MSTRIRGLIEKITPQLEAVDAHLGTVADEAEENGNELARESALTAEVCVRSLEKAVLEKRLEAMPVPALTQIVKLVTDVADATTNAAGNFDAKAGTFTNQVDSLHNRLWADRLIDPSAEVEAHRRAVGELDAAMETARHHIQELRNGVAEKSKIDTTVAALERVKEQIEKVSADSAAQKAEIDRLTGEATTVHGTFTTKTNEIDKLLEQAKTSRAGVTSLESDLNKWHGDIGGKMTEIVSLKDSTETKLSGYDDEIASRKEKLDEIEEKIDEQFKLATSGALAKSFGVRGKWLLVGKVGWGALSITSYFFFVGFTIWVMIETLHLGSPAAEGAGIVVPQRLEPDWIAFAVRISVTIPIGLLVWFVTVQYGKARRVQEAYAFKGTVASSFDAYRDLVAKITLDPALKDRPEYANFIRETIEKIYEPPSMGSEDDDEPPHTRTMKELPSVLKAIGDMAKQFK